jgi:cytochrome c biogenesis protein CcmG/thiol:disulfide interchange protein DsbE
MPPVKKLLYLVPAAAFLVVAGAFLWGLDPERDPREVPSVLIDRPVPEFTLPPLAGMDVPGFATADLQAGQVALVNVFASWCVPCRAEHPYLMRLARDGVVPIYGINYKDKPADALAWLEELGSPYVAIGADEAGRVAIDWGIYGVPETFVIDQTGVIRYRQVGPIFPKVLEEEILPLIATLREGAT